MKLKFLLATTALAGASFAPSAALAQADPQADPARPSTAAQTEEPAVAQAPTEAQAADAARSSNEAGIVVTGSRIKRPNLQSTVPITSVQGTEFHETGEVSIGDVLNELPSLRSTFSQSNSTRFLGTAGLNVLDLRGLGTVRTLTLVNGRRHVAGDVLNTGVSVDVNSIPTDLIERVDVVTGGDSAIYGSDAIAGVVNFVLKQNFQGLEVRGQDGISSYGDAGARFVSVLAGQNFAGGRGNIAVDVEYARQDAYYASQRPNLSHVDGFVVVDTDVPCPGTGCDPNVVNNSDGNPDRIYFRDIRSATISEKGLIQFPGSPFTTNYIFSDDGRTLVPETGERVGIPNQGNTIGGNGDTRREGHVVVLSPNVTRYTANLIGHFEVTPAFVPFLEAKYVRTQATGSVSGPGFTTGGTLGDARERPRIDNPFLSDQARGVIQQFLGAGVTRFTLRKNLVDLGLRDEDFLRQTYRFVGGVRGDFNDSWQYEVSANYGRTWESNTILGNMDTQRFLLAMDSVRDPATGKIVCRSQIDPAARTPYSDAGKLAADIAACVPFNPFGRYVNGPEVAQYIAPNTTSHAEIWQFVANAFISGDSRKWFELPGGPVGFAAGLEYRTENLSFRQDPNVEAGNTFYNSIPTFTAPRFEVKEAFAELRVPLLAHTPFFEELTLSGAARVADYKLGAGTVLAYNAGIDWAPVRDLRFRANYSKAVRSPNQGDLYTPLGQNFAPNFTDPCSLRNIGSGSAARVANCRAAGIPANYDYVYLSSLELQSGGNPDLQAETSKSLTVGAVFQPRIAPGLSLSVDYYDIKVENVITAPTPQQIVNACYDSPDLNNQFCALFHRAGAGGGAGGEEPFRILEGDLQQRVLNYAAQRARGIDVDLAWRHHFEGFGQFNSHLVYTHVLQRDNYLNPQFPTRADQQLLELGDPQDAFNFDFNLKSGLFTLGYKMRYIGKMVVNAYEDFFSKQGRAPENADWADIRFFPAVFYHDIRIGFDAGKRFNFYMGIDNFMNKQPPLGGTGTGGGTAIYSNRGRYFFGGFLARF
jgi:outer membrane receptor protein involved in Fe transport